MWSECYLCSGHNQRIGLSFHRRQHMYRPWPRYSKFSQTDKLQILSYCIPAKSRYFGGHEHVHATTPFRPSTMASVTVHTAYLAIALWIAYYLLDKARNRSRSDIHRLAYPVGSILVTSTFFLQLTYNHYVESYRNLVIGSGATRKRFSMIITTAILIRNGWADRAQC